MSFVVKANIWDKNLEEVLAFIKEATDKERKWTWVMNSRCKYISIRVDMRDGAFVLVDRDGERISLDHLKYQYEEDTELTYPKNSKYDSLMLEKAREALSEIVNKNVPGGAEAVFDIAQEALNEINEHLGTKC